MSKPRNKRTSISKRKLEEYRFVAADYVDMAERLQSVVQEYDLQFVGGGRVDGDLIAGYLALRAELAAATRRAEAAEAKLAEIAILARRYALLLSVDEADLLRDIEAIAKGKLP
jgi:hypothetical protein